MQGIGERFRAARDEGEGVGRAVLDALNLSGIGVHTPAELEAMRAQNSTTITNHNTYNIQGPNPEEIAAEVQRINQRDRNIHDAQRRGNVVQ